ncbi:MAG: hypothetical protein ACQEXJ_08610 [Myxococcota bacterium]
MRLALLASIAALLVGCRAEPEHPPAPPVSEQPPPARARATPEADPAPEPACDGELVPTDEARFRCDVDANCVNTCRYGAVSRRWASRLWDDCEDGCAGPEVAEPRCVEGVCTAFFEDGEDGAKIDDCTRKPVDAPICVAAEHVEDIRRHIRRTYRDPFAPEEDAVPPCRALGRSRQEVAALLGAPTEPAAKDGYTPFRLDVELRFEDGVAVSLRQRLLPGERDAARWARWRSRHQGPEEALTGEEAAAHAGLWAPVPALARPDGWRWKPGELRCGDEHTEIGLQGTYDPKRGVLQVEADRR